MKLGEGVEKGEPLPTTKGPKEQSLVVPLKYNQPETSGLTYDVRKEPQEKNFDLTP